MTHSLITLAALLLAPLASLEAAEPTSGGQLPVGRLLALGTNRGTGQAERAGEVGLRRAMPGQPQDAGVRRRVGGEPGNSRPARAGPAYGGPRNEAGARAGELHYNIDWRRNNWTYLEKESKRAFEAAGDSPAILAWALCDEPGRDLVGEMETFRRKFIAWARSSRRSSSPCGPTRRSTPRRPGSARYAPTSTRSSPPAIPTARTRRPFALMVPPSRPDHARAAQKAGRTPWIMPQCFVEIWGPWKYDEHLDAVMLPGAVLHWRQPSVGEVRWQVWSAVGAGVRGFFWYVYLPPPTDQPEAKPYVGPTFPPTLAAKEATSVQAPAACSGPTAAPRRVPGRGRGVRCAEAAAAAAEGRRAGRSAVGRGLPARMDRRARQPGVESYVRRGGERRHGTWADAEGPLAEAPRRAQPAHRAGAPRAADNTVTVKLGPGDGTLLEEIP